MENSAFEGKILRLIRREIHYALEYPPPSPHIPEFDVFKVDERPGEQFIRLDRKYGETEDVKVEVTMFDGSVPLKMLIILKFAEFSLGGLEQMEDRPYLGPDFKGLDDEMQNSLNDFLETRGVNDNLAVFLHRYMTNKDKVEYGSWMEKVKLLFSEIKKLITDTAQIASCYELELHV